MKKPLKIFRSPLSERYYAVRSYKEIKPGLIEVTGTQEDITDEIKRIMDQAFEAGRDYERQQVLDSYPD